ncbi:MAG: hypothetical protein H0T46_02610 [Deltaproteobacteria bacterium]|nr:hypothetical protein [Deltaproteobacteria bacterium]
MIAKLAGVAIDARARPVLDNLASRAIAARWVAANALAASAVRVSVDGIPPRGPRLFSLRAPCFVGALAALAAMPSLIDLSTVPRGWRLALRALGVPWLEQPAEVALAHGVSVLSRDVGTNELRVELDRSGYLVQFAESSRILA